MDQNETYDVSIDPESPDEGVFKLVEAVRPSWKPETIKKEQLGGGLVNILFKYWDTRFDDAIVVRIFGETLGQYLDKQEEIKVYRLFGELGIGPELLCIFKNGMCTKFVEGKIPSVLKLEELAGSLKLAKAVARKIADYHCEKTKKLAVEKYQIAPEIRLYTIWQKCMDDWTPAVNEVFPIMKSAEFPSKQEIQAEEDMLKKRLVELNLPLVLCHNDLHPGNAIYDVDKDEATLLDHEFCSFYYAPFDLAFYLFYAAFGLGTDPSPEPLPMHPVDYQTEFLHTYLETLSRLDNWSRDVTDDDVLKLRKTADMFLLLVIIEHIIVFVSLCAKPVNPGEEDSSFMWGCLKAWKAYLIKRKDVLGY